MILWLIPEHENQVNAYFFIQYKKSIINNEIFFHSSEGKATLTFFSIHHFYGLVDPEIEQLFFVVTKQKRSSF